jgi:hypothetical protein
VRPVLFVGADYHNIGPFVPDLERAGYDLLLAASGEFGLQLASKGDFDAVVIGDVTPADLRLTISAEARRRGIPVLLLNTKCRLVCFAGRVLEILHGEQVVPALQSIFRPVAV